MHPFYHSCGRRAIKGELVRLTTTHVFYSDQVRVKEMMLEHNEGSPALVIDIEGWGAI